MGISKSNIMVFMTIARLIDKAEAMGFNAQ